VTSRGKVIVLHFVGQMPLAGIAWQAMHYVLGLERLGYEAWYIEDGGANPYDPRANSVVMECDYNVGYVKSMMEAGPIGTPSTTSITDCRASACGRFTPRRMR